MREKYESLVLVQLRELAKVRGLKVTSSMKKADLVEAMLAEDERVKAQEAEESAKSQKTETAADGQEAQQAGESAPEPSRKRNAVTNKRTAASQQKSTRSQSAVQNESNYKAENTVQRESAQKSEEAGAGQGAQAALNQAASAQTSGTGQAAPNQAASAQPAGTGQAAPNQTARPSQPAAGAANQGVSGQAAAPAQRTSRSMEVYDEKTYPKELDSGEEASGILEVMPDGYGFIRCENYLPGENDVYVAPSQIRRFGLKTGDILRGNKRIKTQQEKFSALLFIRTINGYTIEEASKRKAFEDMTPIFPNERIRLETAGCSVAMRVMDLVSPVGKGQRGMIVSPPKAGKTTLLKEVAKSILRSSPHMHMLILLIDERPEEVTDIREAIIGANVEVIYSTFDELPEHHKRVAEMVE